MTSVNKTILLGNLGKDPEIRATTDGREVANLVLATEAVWKDKATGEKKSETTWHKIACFNTGIITIIRDHLKKGSKIYVEGTLKNREWTDKDGIKRYQTEVVLQGYNCTLTMLSPKQKDEHNQDSGYNEAEANQDLNDSIPF